jgi:DNA-binding LacI/PurR family transcriptional regulator
MNFAFGVTESTQDRELTVALIPGDFPASKARSLHVDGFVMADVDGQDALARAILTTGRPVVTSELVPADMPPPTAAVVADHTAATHLILDRLQSGGATSIAVLSPDVDQTWIRAVADAAAQWSTAAGVRVSLVPLDGVPGAADLRTIISDLITGRPDIDAIVCVPEGLGVGILSTLRELGCAVPDDIQLISYVDSATLPIVQPPISALDLRPREAGKRAGQLLVSLLESGERARAATPAVELFDLIYRERASTRAPRA